MKTVQVKRLIGTIIGISTLFAASYSAKAISETNYSDVPKPEAKTIAVPIHKIYVTLENHSSYAQCIWLPSSIGKGEKASANDNKTYDAGYKYQTSLKEISTQNYDPSFLLKSKNNGTIEFMVCDDYSKDAGELPYMHVGDRFAADDMIGQFSIQIASYKNNKPAFPLGWIGFFHYDIDQYLIDKYSTKYVFSQPNLFYSLATPYYDTRNIIYHDKNIKDKAIVQGEAFEKVSFKLTKFDLCGLDAFITVVITDRSDIGHEQMIDGRN